MDGQRHTVSPEGQREREVSGYGRYEREGRKVKFVVPRSGGSLLTTDDPDGQPVVTNFRLKAVIQTGEKGWKASLIGLSSNSLTITPNLNQIFTFVYAKRPIAI